MVSFAVSLDVVSLTVPVVASFVVPAALFWALLVPVFVLPHATIMDIVSAIRAINTDVFIFFMISLLYYTD
jgi:hypothetical protein